MACSTSAASAADSRQHSGLIEAGREGDHAVARHPPIGGLDPRHAGQRRRLSDRTAGIGARRVGRQPGRGSGGGSPGRAARHLAEVPRILDRAVVARFVGGAHGEFVHVGLAQHHGAGGLEARHHGRIVGRDEVVEHARAAAGAHPVRAENIFMNEGDAEQRARSPAARRRSAAAASPAPAQASA
jgi:hypothetical protein